MHFTIQTDTGWDAHEFDVEAFEDGWYWNTKEDQSMPFPTAAEAQADAIRYAREEDVRLEEENAGPCHKDMPRFHELRGE